MLRKEDLFKGLCFYLEIFTEGQSKNSVFEDAIVERGGKLTCRLGKHVTHMVWSQGRPNTLKKALDYKSIKIVSSLWLQQTFEHAQLVDETKFQPGALQRLIEKRNRRQIKQC